MKKLRDYAPFLLRLVFGGQLIYYVYPNIVSLASMREFADYLAKMHVPLPLPFAFVAAYTEFLGGILMILGWQTRIAGALLTINFLVAFFVAHIAIGDTYANTYPSLHHLAMAVFLLLNGPGKPSIDEGV
jgi:putative oxidoreductase